MPLHILVAGYKFVFEGCASFLSIITGKYKEDLVLSIAYIPIKQKQNKEEPLSNNNTKEETKSPVFDLDIKSFKTRKFTSS